MIVVTTPTGDVGSQVLAELLNVDTQPLRVIARDPSRLQDTAREQVEVIVGSHADPFAVLSCGAGVHLARINEKPDGSSVAQRRGTLWGA